MHTKGPSDLKLSQKSTDDKHTIRLVAQQSAWILLKIRARFCCVNDRTAKLRPESLDRSRDGLEIATNWQTGSTTEI